MLFNTIEYGIFLVLVFYIYWFVLGNSVKLQNCFILISSYIFYGWWDWRFLSLIAISSFADFIIGRSIGITINQRIRKLLLLLSLLINLGVLGFFKYFDFFIGSFVELLGGFGIQVNSMSLRIILPVGISFYTFQTLSYTIDIYRRKLNYTNDAIQFFSFVAFFPQLVAGPIERAKNLLPQFAEKRILQSQNIKEGLRQIVWGLFKKVVIADNCANIVDSIFSNYSTLNGSALIIGGILFAFQIYGDFSGYSDIAIGSARLLGFRLMKNFAYPYFSRDIAEFWRRWHISLSTWFRDYVYIPLGGSKVSKIRRIRNIFIIFIVSGLWHGANWTFVFWGMLHAIYYLPLLLFNKQRDNLEIVNANKIIPIIRSFINIIVTFSLTTLAWIFFRSASIREAFDYIRLMISDKVFENPFVLLDDLQVNIKLLYTLATIALLVMLEWFGRYRDYPLQFKNTPLFSRWAIYYLIIISILLFRNTGVNVDFIYFQF